MSKEKLEKNVYDVQEVKDAYEIIRGMCSLWVQFIDYPKLDEHKAEFLEWSIEAIHIARSLFEDKLIDMGEEDFVVRR